MTASYRKVTGQASTSTAAQPGSLLQGLSFNLHDAASESRSGSPSKPLLQTTIGYYQSFSSLSYLTASKVTKAMSSSSITAPTIHQLLQTGMTRSVSTPGLVQGSMVVTPTTMLQRPLTAPCIVQTEQVRQGEVTQKVQYHDFPLTSSGFQQQTISQPKFLSVGVGERARPTTVHVAVGRPPVRPAGRGRPPAAAQKTSVGSLSIAALLGHIKATAPGTGQAYHLRFTGPSTVPSASVVATTRAAPIVYTPVRISSAPTPVSENITQPLTIDIPRQEPSITIGTSKLLQTLTAGKLRDEAEAQKAAAQVVQHSCCSPLQGVYQHATGDSDKEVAGILPVAPSVSKSLDHLRKESPIQLFVNPTAEQMQKETPIIVVSVAGNIKAQTVPSTGTGADPLQPASEPRTAKNSVSPSTVESQQDFKVLPTVTIEAGEVTTMEADRKCTPEQDGLFCNKQNEGQTCAEIDVSKNDGDEIATVSSPSELPSQPVTIIKSAPPVNVTPLGETEIIDLTDSPPRHFPVVTKRPGPTTNISHTLTSVTVPLERQSVIPVTPANAGLMLLASAVTSDAELRDAAVAAAVTSSESEVMSSKSLAAVSEPLPVVETVSSAIVASSVCGVSSVPAEKPLSAAPAGTLPDFALTSPTLVQMASTSAASDLATKAFVSSQSVDQTESDSTSRKDVTNLPSKDDTSPAVDAAPEAYHGPDASSSTQEEISSPTQAPSITEATPTAAAASAKSSKSAVPFPTIAATRTRRSKSARSYF